MVTDDPRRSTRLILPGRQRRVLETLVRRTHCPQAIAQRARVVLAAADGLGMADAGRRVGCSREVARRWRDRVIAARAAWGAAADEWDEATLAGKLVGLLEDRERPGAPATFTPEQLCQIVALACEVR